MPKNNDWLLDSTEFNPTAKSEPSTPLAHANSSVISTSFCHPDDYDFIVSQIEANIAGTISTHQQSIISTSKSLTQPQQHQPKTDRLTAETLRIFSSINIENLSFTSKFDLLFNDLSMLKATAVQGLLGDTNFRFLSWMIFLECVPMEKNSWLDVIGQNRLDYERIKKELACDPQLVKNSSEWAVNFDHPLSQDETSVWNNYFEQNRVKSVIIQDVNRINQHSAYFALESTRDSIVNLIFMYVQSMKVEYKQGMHEILTCIMFVLHEEYSSLTKLSETNEIIRGVVSLRYLEHDTYTIFKALMERIHPWFGTKSNTKLNKSMLESMITQTRRNSLTSLTPVLFQDNEEFYESTIINKINFITDKVLHNNDIEIFNHLNLIGVTLHPFGIRWLRLLFIRELEFPQCLILWDAMFATDNKELNLVSYIFVALLACLRDELLKMDNSNCMKLLMQPHFHLDPLDVLKTALYLQDPAVYKRPNSMENSYELVNDFYSKDNNNNVNYRSRSNRVITSSPSMQTVKANNNNNSNRDVYKTNSNKKKSTSDFDLSRLNTKLADLVDSSLRLKNDGKNFEMRLLRSLEHTGHNTDLITHAYISKILELQNENDHLVRCLKTSEENCRLASAKIDSNVKDLQEEMEKGDVELINLAIDGLKQTSHQLKSNLTLNFSSGL